MELDKIKSKPRYTKINKEIARFPVKEDPDGKAAQTSPVKYHVPADWTKAKN